MVDGGACVLLSWEPYMTKGFSWEGFPSSDYIHLHSAAHSGKLPQVTI